MRKKLVAGNWKMHGSVQANAALIQQVLAGVSGLKCDILVCPPFPYLAQVRTLLGVSGIALGAQSVSEYEAGAYTGEVAASMLMDLGCGYVLVGHSERRAMFGETDAVVAAKFASAQRVGLVPILCVGETYGERQAGLTAAVVSRQVRVVLERCGVDAFFSAIVAYEPVWAIGTGMTASPEQAQEVHAMIRELVAGYHPQLARGLRILYGGSVKAQNAATLFAQDDVDGGLIGGAALVADDFVAICQAAG